MKSDRAQSEIIRAEVSRWRPWLFLLVLTILPATFLLKTSAPGSDFGVGVIAERFGDYPVIALDVHQAHLGQLMNGPYSRLVFHHPSPLLAYWYAAFESLGVFGTGYAAFEAGQAIFNTLCLGLAFFGMWTLTGTLLAPALLASIGIFLFQTARLIWLVDIWGPATTLAPSLALMVAAACVLSGRIQFLAVASFAAGAAIASHIGGVPLVFGLWLLAFVSYLRQRGLRSHSYIFLLSVLIFAIIFIAPLCEILASPTYGNLKPLVNFLHRPRPTLGFAGALHFLFDYPFRAFGWTGILAALCSFGCCAVFAFRSCSNERCGAQVATAALALSIVATSRIVVPAAEHLQWQFWAILTFAVTIAILVVVKFRFPMLLKFEPLVGMVAALPFLYLSSEPVRESALAFDAAPSLQFLANLKKPVEIDPGNRKEWEAAAILLRAVALSSPQALGTDVCTSKRWEFMFRPALTCKQPSESVAEVWRTKADLPATSAGVLHGDLITIISTRARESQDLD